MFRAVLAATLLTTYAYSADPPAPSGEQLFEAKCASCHNMDGSKALTAGRPLREREVADADMEEQVAGRMDETATRAEKDALIAFVRGITKRRKP